MYKNFLYDFWVLICNCYLKYVIFVILLKMCVFKLLVFWKDLDIYSIVGYIIIIFIFGVICFIVFNELLIGWYERERDRERVN